MRVFFDIGLMGLREQPATADQHFVPPCLVCMIGLYANVGALEHGIVASVCVVITDVYHKIPKHLMTVVPNIRLPHILA